MIFVLALIYFDVKWGMALLLLSLFLLPEMAIGFGGTVIKKNYILLGALLIFFVKFKYLWRYELDVSPYRFVIVYLSLCLIMIPIQFGLGYSSQLHFWLTDFILCLLLPVAFWNTLNKFDCIQLFRGVILSCILVSTLYGLCLLTTDGFNPYSLLFASEFRDYDYVALMTSYYEPGGGRPFGRISSVFYHPMNYALFLGLSLIYLLQIRKNLPRAFFVFLVVLITINILVCGVRTILVALFAASTLFVLMLRNTKLLAVSAVFAFSSYTIIMLTPLSDLVQSIVSPQKSGRDVSGSSIELRLDQLGGALDEVQGCMLEGKGYGWNRDYQANYGDHPVLLAFESLVFMVLCNNGILGFVFWGLYILAYFHYIDSMVWETEYRALLKFPLLLYIVFALITGDYGYMTYFMLFYTLMLYEYGIRNESEGLSEEEDLIEQQ